MTEIENKKNDVKKSNFIIAAWNGEISNGFKLKAGIISLQFIVLFFSFFVSHVLTSDPNPLDPEVMEKYRQNSQLYLLCFLPVQLWIIVSMYRYAKAHSKMGFFPEMVQLFFFLIIYYINLI